MKRYFPAVRDPISVQSRTTYEDYKKIKGFEDVGYFLESYVVSGGEATKNITHNNRIDVASIVVSLNNDIMARDGTSMRTNTPNTIYYLDFEKSGDFTWSTSHAPGTAGVDYLPIASVTTDEYANVDAITDERGDVGGFLLKSEFGLDNYVRDTEFEEFKDEVDTDLAAQKADLASRAINVKYPPSPLVAAAGNWNGTTGTDDTAAIQAVIDLLSSGGRIEFPDGNYMVTDTLKYDDFQIFEAVSKGNVTITMVGSGKPVFQPRTQLTAATYHLAFRYLTINNNDISKLPGSIGLDLRECSYVSVYACRFRHHEYGIRLGNDADVTVVGGFYQSVVDCEIVSNKYGVYFGQAANAVVVEGGRIFGNEIGTYFGACSGNRINTTYERNDIGVEFGPGSFLNTIVGGYFEGNAQDGVGAYIPDKGAVIFRSGSFYNVILSAKFANATDQVNDLDGRNISFSMGASGKSPTAKLGNGKNLVTNGLMERDSNADGIADGWAFDAAVPGGTTVALDTSVKTSAAQSQRITLAAAGTSQRRFFREIRGLAIGVPHILRIVVRTDLNNGFNVRVGNTNSGAQYVNSVIPNTGGWVTISEPFVPTQSNVFVWIFQQPEAYGVKGADANIWIDSLSVEAGMFASLQSLDRTPTANGATSTRPTLPDVGDQFFDTTLSKPLWHDGSAWREHTRWVAVPASATASGLPGDIAADASFLYVCHAANAWRRVAVATW